LLAEYLESVWGGLGVDLTGARMFSGLSCRVGASTAPDFL